MSYGIRATGTDLGGDFIVTDTDLNLINYGVSAKGRASSFQLPALGGTKFIFVKNPGTLRDYYKVQQSASSITFRGYDIDQIDQYTINPVANPTTVAFDYFVIQTLPDLPSSGEPYGFQLFTEAGTLAFDSSRIQQNDSMEIRQVIQPDMSGLGGAEITFEDSALDYVNIEWSIPGYHDVSGIALYSFKATYLAEDIIEYQDNTVDLEYAGNYSVFMSARLRG